MAKQYPSIRRKFTRYAAYTSATIEDIFSAKELEGALQLKAETFSSAWFENVGNGDFISHRLPVEAQFSEVHGILPIDLNADGHLDLMLTGNNYSADVEAGQNDASIGTVLLGDGKGNFSSLSAEESGFDTPEDTRDIVKIGKTIFVMVNSGKPYAFQHNQ